MAKDIKKIVQQMKQGSNNVRFNDLCKVCERYFGSPRQSSGSHEVYKTPWAGDPRVNIQNDRGKGKSYQVKQVLQAIDKLETEKRKAEQVKQAASAAEIKKE